jgi:hypothetical protein
MMERDLADIWRNHQINGRFGRIPNLEMEPNLEESPEIKSGRVQHRNFRFSLGPSPLMLFSPWKDVIRWRNI